MSGWRGWLWAALLSLSGCAALPVAQTPAVLNTAAPHSFELDGRMAVRYQQNSSLASLHWQHADDNDSLTLSSPLGQTVAQLTRDRNGVTLIDSQQHTHTASTVAALTERLLGWRLPLEGLTYWIVGSAVPGQAFQLLSPTNQGSLRLQQLGWIVTYERWTQVMDKTLPDKITLTGYGVVVHLIISHWDKYD